MKSFLVLSVLGCLSLLGCPGSPPGGEGEGEGQEGEGDDGEGEGEDGEGEGEGEEGEGEGEDGGEGEGEGDRCLGVPDVDNPFDDHGNRCQPTPFQVPFRTTMDVIGTANDEDCVALDLPAGTYRFATDEPCGRKEPFYAVLTLRQGDSVVERSQFCSALYVALDEGSYTLCVASSEPRVLGDLLVEGSAQDRAGVGAACGSHQGVCGEGLVCGRFDRCVAAPTADDHGDRATPTPASVPFTEAVEINTLALDEDCFRLTLPEGGYRFDTDNAASGVCDGGPDAQVASRIAVYGPDGLVADSPFFDSRFQGSCALLDLYLEADDYTVCAFMDFSRNDVDNVVLRGQSIAAGAVGADCGVALAAGPCGEGLRCLDDVCAVPPADDFGDAQTPTDIPFPFAEAMAFNRFDADCVAFDVPQGSYRFEVEADGCFGVELSLFDEDGLEVRRVDAEFVGCNPLDATLSAGHYVACATAFFEASDEVVFRGSAQALLAGGETCEFQEVRCDDELYCDGVCTAIPADDFGDVLTPNEVALPARVTLSILGPIGDTDCIHIEAEEGLLGIATDGAETGECTGDLAGTVRVQDDAGGIDFELGPCRATLFETSATGFTMCASSPFGAVIEQALLVTAGSTVGLGDACTAFAVCEAGLACVDDTCVAE